MSSTEIKTSFLKTTLSTYVTQHLAMLMSYVPPGPIGRISLFIWTFQCLTLVLACRSFLWAACQITNIHNKMRKLTTSVAWKERDFIYKILDMYSADVAFAAELCFQWSVPFQFSMQNIFHVFSVNSCEHCLAASPFLVAIDLYHEKKNSKHLITSIELSWLLQSQQNLNLSRDFTTKKRKWKMKYKLIKK